MKPPKIEVADPFRKEIDSFHALAPLLLPEQVNTERLRGIDEYEDYVMLTYSLAKPLGITKMMDDMEDLVTVALKLSYSITVVAENSCLRSIEPFSMV